MPEYLVASLLCSINLLFVVNHAYKQEADPTLQGPASSITTMPSRWRRGKRQTKGQTRKPVR